MALCQKSEDISEATQRLRKLQEKATLTPGEKLECEMLLNWKYTTTLVIRDHPLPDPEKIERLRDAHRKAADILVTSLLAEDHPGQPALVKDGILRGRWDAATADPYKRSSEI